MFWIIDVGNRNHIDILTTVNNTWIYRGHCVCPYAYVCQSTHTGSALILFFGYVKNFFLCLQVHVRIERFT